MSQFLLVAAVALTVGTIGFGVAVLITGEDPGLEPTEPDGRALPLPSDRPLAEPDLAQVRFDTAVRGYRMAQVDAAIRRTAYDLGYKDELIKVLQAEVAALREGRLPDAEVLRRAREASLPPRDRPAHPAPAQPDRLAEPPHPQLPHPQLPHPQLPHPQLPHPQLPHPQQAAESPEQPADTRSGESDAPVSEPR